MLKIARLLGVLASLGALSLYIMFVFFNPYSEGSLTLPIVAMMVLAVVGFITALKAKPYLMLAIFVVSFLPVGFYMLGTPGLFMWIGISNLLFFVASLLMIAEPFIGKLRRRAKSL